MGQVGTRHGVSLNTPYVPPVRGEGEGVKVYTIAYAHYNVIFVGTTNRKCW